MLHTVIVVIQVLSAIGVIVLVLLQHGKGADAGASFGSGASQTVFGSAGSGNFLTHTTAICAVIFFSASLGLAHLNKKAVTTMGALNFDKTLVQPKVSPAPVSDLPALPANPAADTDLPAPAANVDGSNDAANTKATSAPVEAAAAPETVPTVAPQ